MELVKAAVTLAENLQLESVPALIIHGAPVVDVLVVGMEDGLLATLCAALDENPELIRLFATALALVKLHGVSSGDPDLQSIVFPNEVHSLN